jgi:hypothetical protein
MENIRYFNFDYHWPSLKKVYEQPHIAKFAKEQAFQFRLDGMQGCTCDECIDEYIDHLEGIYDGYPSSLDRSDARYRNRKRAGYYKYVLYQACHFMMPVHLLALQEWRPQDGWFGIFGDKHSCCFCFSNKTIYDPQFKMMNCLEDTHIATSLATGDYTVIDTIYAGPNKVILVDINGGGKYFREIDLN